MDYVPNEIIQEFSSKNKNKLCKNLHEIFQRVLKISYLIDLSKTLHHNTLLTLSICTSLPFSAFSPPWDIVMHD